MSSPSWPPAPVEATSTELDLVEAGEQTTLDAWESMVRVRPGCEFERHDEFYLHSFPAPMESLNEVRITNQPSDPESILGRAAAYFARRSPRWRLVCPPRWAALLEGPCRTVGLEPAPWEPVMVLPVLPTGPAAPLEDFECRRVEGPADLEAFGRTFAEADGLAESDFWTSQNLPAPRWDLFLGRLRGRPVSTGVGFTSGAVTGVWGIATVPEFRGRGLGSATTWAVVQGGKRWGARATHLWATQMGFPVYRRMGFHHVENKPIWKFRGPG